jgi:HEAT repeat protein
MYKMGLFDLFKPNVKKLEEKRDILGLIKALSRNKTDNEQLEIAEALGRMGESAVEPLIQYLKDDSKKIELWKTGYWVAMALVKIGDKAVLPLIQFLNNSKNSEYGRIAAIDALGRIGDTKAIESLVQTLKEKKDVRKTALKSLEELKWKFQNDTENVYYLIAKEEWYNLVKFGKTAVEPLCQILVYNESEYVIKISKVLGEIKDKRSVYPLIKFLFDRNISRGFKPDESEEISISIAKSLAEIGDINALLPLRYIKEMKDRRTPLLLQNSKEIWAIKGAILILEEKSPEKDISYANRIHSMNGMFTEEQKYLFFRNYPLFKETIDRIVEQEGISLENATTRAFRDFVIMIAK